MAESLLQLSDVQTHIRPYHILHGVSFDIPAGALTVLLGRNGAGKTTTLRTIMGLWQASAGRIRFNGRDITAASTPEIARSGIAYVPEAMGIFSDLTVRENIVLAARSGPVDKARLDWMLGLFPALRRFWNLPAGNLSGGQKQMLAIARAIAEPRRLLLVDEPTKGLAPVMVRSMIEAFRALKAAGGTILLVEQNFHAASALGDHVLVMDDGRIVHSGPMSDLVADKTLQQRLLGLSLDAHPMTDIAVESAAAELPRNRTDWLLLLLVPALALLALPFVGSPSTWVTLTVAGLAMGMMIFLMASGLTLVFGLMDIINFGHGVFISLGAYATLLVLGPLAGWAQADSIGLNLALLGLCIVAAMALTGIVGAVFERVIVRPVYGSHLKQILVTMGGLIVAEQAIHAIWGASPIPIPLPQSLRGAFVLGDIVMERYRVVAVAIGLLVFAAMQLILNRTRLGLLIRAGVENPEMVEALGYRIRRLFVSVFVAGSALAGLGGVMWAFYRQTLTAGMGMEVVVLVFIVIIIGGLGSVGGCFVGSILVALVANYVGFIEPKLALISNILVMALVLIWRPQGLFPVARR